MEKSLYDFHSIIIESENEDTLISFQKAFAKGILCAEKNGETFDLDGVNIYQYCDKCSSCCSIEKDTSLNNMFFGNLKGTDIKVKDVLAIQNYLQLGSSDRIKIAYIHRADNMTIIAQNKMLKLLEEPYANTKIILGVTSKERLLDTVKSRCISFKLDSKVADISLEEGREFIDLILKGGRFNRVTEIVDDVKNPSVFLKSLEIILSDGKKDDFSKRNLDLLHLVLIANKRLKLGLNQKYTLKRLALEAGFIGDGYR